MLAVGPISDISPAILPLREFQQPIGYETWSAAGAFCGLQTAAKPLISQCLGDDGLQKTPMNS